MGLKVVCAYPGSGKTSVAKEHKKYVDMDYGHFRKDYTGKHFYQLDWVERVYCADVFARKIIRQWESSGRPDTIYLVNDLDVVNALLWSTVPDVDVIILYPDKAFRDVWYNNLISRDGNDSEFIRALQQNEDEWKHNWVSQALFLSFHYPYTRPNGHRCELFWQTGYLCPEYLEGLFPRAERWADRVSDFIVG
jgi:hypothetical protein